MPTVEFRLPDLGEGLQEATIVAWLVGVGDQVTLDQPLCEVETDKATTELPSPVAGRVVALGAEAGGVVPVGGLVVTLDAAGPHAAGSPPAETTPAAGETLGPVLVGSGAAAPASPARRRRPVISGGTAAAAGAPHAVPAGAPVSRSPRPAPPPERPSTGDGEVVPLVGTRARLADRVTRARRDIPDASCTLTADASALLETTDQLRAEATAAGLDASPLTPFALIARCVVAALIRHPRLNATFESSGEAGTGVRLHRHVNLAFAVDTLHGLVAPVIAGADAMTTLELAVAVRDLADSARARRLRPTQVTGGSFTVTNHGSFGTDDGSPILNPPQVGILAVGAIKARPHVVAGDVVARPTVILTCVFDHRACDGADAGRFLAAVGRLIEQPARLLLDAAGGGGAAPDPLG